MTVALALVDPASLSVVGLQDIGTDGARFHVDLEPMTWTRR
ncbi:MAG TPA: hypothetical protein VFX60_08800 [Micromonospora sp.]|nr:hypothetical protein [Micromonospora sp.]